MTHATLTYCAVVPGGMGCSSLLVPAEIMLRSSPAPPGDDEAAARLAIDDRVDARDRDVARRETTPHRVWMPDRTETEREDAIGARP
jgi:hypothetical protein